MIKERPLPMDREPNYGRPFNPLGECDIHHIPRVLAYEWRTPICPKCYEIYQEMRRREGKIWWGMKALECAA